MRNLSLWRRRSESLPAAPDHAFGQGKRWTGPGDSQAPGSGTVTGDEEGKRPFSGTRVRMPIPQRGRMTRQLFRIPGIIILILVVSLSFLPSPAKAETRIVFTVAAGGVAGGIYFFFRIAAQASASGGHHGMVSPLKENDLTALFNHGPRGWQIGHPAPLPLTTANNLSPPSQGPQTVHFELLKIRF